MDVLGLNPEWLETDEANEMLFGQNFDYDGCGPLGERPISTKFADRLRQVAAGEVLRSGPPTIINEEEFLQALAEAEAQAQEDSDRDKDSDGDEIYGD